MKKGWNDFIPGTSPREIAPGVFFQPIRSWSSLTYAGEGLEEVQGDKSGCLQDARALLPMCRQPRTVTHRIYWMEGSDKRISSFLSYPGAMGHFGPGTAMGTYFWEIYPVGDGDIERFGTEEEMEKRVLELLQERS